MKCKVSLNTNDGHANRVVLCVFSRVWNKSLWLVWIIATILNILHDQQPHRFNNSLMKLDSFEFLRKLSQKRKFCIEIVMFKSFECLRVTKNCFRKFSIPQNGFLFIHIYSFVYILMDNPNKSLKTTYSDFIDIKLIYQYVY